MRRVNKIALVDAALSGLRTEVIPFSVWFHFPDSARGGAACARAHLEHYRRYDLDYLKVMNDNLYDMPAAMPVVRLAKDWLKLEPLTADADHIRHVACLARAGRFIGRPVPC